MTVLSLLLAAVLAAAPASFDVVPDGPGPQRTEVTAALLAASARGDLADLRLRDRAGREVPYLLVPPPAAAPRREAVARIRPTPVRPRRESGAELDLGAPKDVAGVRLDVPAPASFLRALRVEGSVDGTRWTTLAADASVYVLAPEGAAAGLAQAVRNEEVRFAPARARFLRVVFDDRRAPPLPPLRGAEVVLAAAGAAPQGPRVPLEVARREGEPGVSRFALVLPGPHLPVQAVELDVDAAHLFRAARVEEPRLDAGRLVPHLLGEGRLVRAERDGVSVAALAIPVAAPEARELELAVEDGDGAPLALRAAAAVLAPLPWIYWESLDGAPLTATVGDATLAAPRYDLEALRGALSAPASPRARGLRAAPVQGRAAAPPRAAPAADLRATEAGAPGARIDPAVFRVRRAVAAAEPGLAAVRLDAAALAASPGLADVRLATADGRQVPYLLEERPEPLRVALAPSAPVSGSAAARPGATVRALPLPFGAAPSSRLILETDVRVFSRAVRVYAGGAEDPRLERRPVAEATWAHADPSRPAPALSVVLPAVRAERLLVAVDDGDNAPLPIASAALLLPAVRLRFFHPGAELALLQGADGLAAPRYDLALLGPALRAAPAREVALAAPPPARALDRLTARGGFLVALGAAVIALLALVVRLVRSEASSPHGR
jgi:hypothetical protein